MTSLSGGTRSLNDVLWWCRPVRVGRGPGVYHPSPRRASGLTRPDRLYSSPGMPSWTLVSDLRRSLVHIAAAVLRVYSKGRHAPAPGRSVAEGCFFFTTGRTARSIGHCAPVDRAFRRACRFLPCGLSVFNRYLHFKPVFKPAPLKRAPGFYISDLLSPICLWLRICVRHCLVVTLPSGCVDTGR